MSKKALTDQQARKVVAEVFGQKALNIESVERVARFISGADRSSNLWSLVDKGLESLGVREAQEKDRLRSLLIGSLDSYLNSR